MQLALFSTTKICSKCNIEKPVSEFHKNTSAKDGIKSMCKSCTHQYYAVNSAKANEASAIWHAANIETARERREKGRRYFTDNIDKVREQGSLRRASLTKKLTEKIRMDANKLTEQARKWRANNREKTSLYAYSRRAREHNAEGNCDVIKLKNRKSMYGSKCYLCGADATAVDHVKPLFNGGSNWPSNLRPICTKCNSSKGAKWPYELNHIPLTRFAEFSRKYN